MGGRAKKRRGGKGTPEIGDSRQLDLQFAELEERKREREQGRKML